MKKRIILESNQERAQDPFDPCFNYKLYVPFINRSNMVGFFSLRVVGL